MNFAKFSDSNDWNNYNFFYCFDVSLILCKNKQKCFKKIDFEL